MKRFYFRFRVMLITFALGLASVGFYGIFKNSDQVFVDLPEVKSSDVFTVFPKERKSLYGSKRFMETGRGCGRGGYVQAYISNDGTELREGNLCRKPSDLDERIIQKNNERVISKIELKNETYYEIYQLKNGHCIDSPSIEIGLELENYIKQNHK